MLTRVLPGIVAAGIIVSGMVLWRICGLRGLRRVRWIVPGLATYGAATFVYAAVAGITLRETLSGAVLQELPYFLRGAFVGAFVVLPLGWVASVLRTGFPRFRNGLAAPGAFQAVALTTCVALLFTSLPRDQGTSGLAAPMSPKERLQALDKSLRAMDDHERKSPRDHWDADYVVSIVGRDPQRLFAWVRDNTFWVPYRGVLRGAIGVLMDRQGNSLDRSLLLATLLEKAGHPVRLAHGELSQDEVVKLLPELTARRRVYSGEPRALHIAEPAHGEPVADSMARQEAAYGDIEDENVEEVTAHYQPVADAIGTKFNVSHNTFSGTAVELESRVAAETAGLLAGLDKPDPRKEWAGRFQAAIKALGDHWWVQLQEGQSWTDFDLLSGPGSQAALAVPSETAALHNVPPDLHHQITIRVMTEQWSGDAFTSRKALEYSLRPGDVIGQSITLQFWPTAWLTDFDSSAPKHTLLEAASQDQWAAALSIGKESVSNTFLVETGAAEDTRGGDLGGLGQAVAGALAGSSKPQAELTSVWIEYEVRVPGEKAKIVRRTVFDLFGPDARAAGRKLSLPLDHAKQLTRGLALMMRTEIEPIACAIAPDFVQHMVAQNFLANRSLFTAVARREVQFPNTSTRTTPGTEQEQQNTPQQFLGAAAPPPSPLLSLAAARLRSDGITNPVFISRPNILTRHRFFIPAGEQIAAMEAIDIAANEVGIDLAEPEAFAIRIWQGVLDTNLEAHVGFRAAIDNVGEAFAGSRDWAILTPSQRSILERLSLSADVRRRITEDLDSGYVVVAPKAPAPHAGEQFVGWWRINPATGDALGVAANGWGQGLAERGPLTSMAATSARYFLFEYGLCQSFPMAVNSLRVINEEFFGAWHPSWTGPGPKAVNPMDIADFNNQNTRMCLVQAITAGFIATLPLLLITLRARGARLAAEELEAAAAAAKNRVNPLAKTQVDPLANTQVDPLANTQVNPLDNTQVDPLAKTAKANTQPPQPRSAAPTLPQTVAEAKQSVDRALAAKEAASAKSDQATKKFVQYVQNDPEFKSPLADPSVEWNQNVEDELRIDARRKSLDDIRALREYEQAVRAYDTAYYAALRKP
jgi:hypothetical protein